MTHLSHIVNLIRIRISTRLEDEDAELYHANYIFSYRIIIENNSANPVQLLRRHWVIKDALAGTREVQGEGVVGEQPVIEAGAQFSYESWCPTLSEIGTMSGYYTFLDLDSNEEFQVEIPTFHLNPEHVLN